MPFGGKKRTLGLPFVLVAGVILLLAFGSARGALVTVEITGRVTEVNDPGGVLAGQINIYDIFTGIYRYDSGIPDSNPSVSVGDYWYDTWPFGISLNIGGLPFASDPQNVDFLIEINNGPTDSYLLASDNNLPLSGAAVGQILWQIEYNTDTIFTSDGLPLTAPVLDGWTSNLLRIDGGAMHIRAEIIGAEIVPEPASLMLLGLGAALIASRCRHVG